MVALDGSRNHSQLSSCLTNDLILVDKIFDYAIDSAVAKNIYIILYSLSNMARTKLAKFACPFCKQTEEHAAIGPSSKMKIN